MFRLHLTTISLHGFLVSPSLIYHKKFAWVLAVFFLVDDSFRILLEAHISVLNRTANGVVVVYPRNCTVASCDIPHGLLFIY